MNYLDLQAIRKLLVDLRFIQAAAIVAVGVHDIKIANDYMKRIKLAEKSIDDELSRLREIKSDGGADLEVPIECVRDCPDCAKPVADESPRFKTEDHDLTTLLELTVDIYSGICNHDTAVWWHETLGKVEAKLTPVDAKAIRAEALEDAVKFLEENGMIAPNGFTADGIRGLK